MLKNLEDRVLIDQTKIAVKKEKKLTAEVISYLQEISDRRLYVEYGAHSLFKFCTKVLNYSDAEAALRIKAVRVIQKMPEAKMKIADGSVSLSSLALVDTFMKANPKKKINISEVTHKTKEQTRKVLEHKSEKPLPQIKTIHLNDRLLKKLAKIQGDFKDLGELEIFEVLLDGYIRNKAQGRSTRSERGSKQQRYISRKVREFVFKRANYQCEGITRQKRCSAKTFLEIDHIRPIAWGGMSSRDNLRVLCRACNQRAWMRLKGPIISPHFL